MPDLKHITGEAEDTAPATASAPGSSETRKGPALDREATTKTWKDSRESGFDPYNNVGSGIFKTS